MVLSLQESLVAVVAAQQEGPRAGGRELGALRAGFDCSAGGGLGMLLVVSAARTKLRKAPLSTDQTQTRRQRKGKKLQRENDRSERRGSLDRKHRNKERLGEIIACGHIDRPPGRSRRTCGRDRGAAGRPGPVCPPRDSAAAPRREWHARAIPVGPSGKRHLGSWGPGWLCLPAIEPGEPWEAAGCHWSAAELGA